MKQQCHAVGTWSSLTRLALFVLGTHSAWAINQPPVLPAGYPFAVQPVSASSIQGSLYVAGAPTLVTSTDVPADLGAQAVFDWDGNDSFSIEFWMQGGKPDPQADGEPEVIVGRHKGSGELHWWVGISHNAASPGVAAFFIGDVDTPRENRLAAKSTTVINDGHAHHILAVRDAAAHEIRLYVDGLLEATVSEPATPENPAEDYLFDNGFRSALANLTIGHIETRDEDPEKNDYTGTLPYGGVAVYSQALNAADLLLVADPDDTDTARAQVVWTVNGAPLSTPPENPYVLPPQPKGTLVKATVTLTDQWGEPSATSVQTPDVLVDNTNLTAMDDTLTTPEDIPVSYLLTEHPTRVFDADGDTLTVTSIISLPNSGLATVLPNGTGVQYVPNQNWVGVDNFKYKVVDGRGGMAWATVVVTVTAVNDAPVAGDDTATAIEDTPLTIAAADLLDNDTDIDSTPFVDAVSSPSSAGGTVLLQGTDIYYTPPANFTGDDTFTYTISDGTLTDTATVTVSVTAVNDAPVAGDDTATASEDTQAIIPAADLLANDSDVDSTPVVHAVSSPSSAGGTVVLQGTDIYYTPPANFAGDDTFTYTISDGTLTDTATVTVSVTAINDAPVAVDDSILKSVHSTDTVIDIDTAELLGNDLDVDSTPVVSAVSAMSNLGWAVSLEGSTIHYNTEAGFLGEDSFTYTITDGELSDTATVTLTVRRRVEVELALHAGWNIIALPMIPDQDGDPSKLLREAPEVDPAYVAPVWQWDATIGRYRQATALQAGIGYWVYCLADAVVSLSGAQLDDDMVTLESSWNLRGATGYQAISDLNQVEGGESLLQEGAIFKFNGNGEYELVDNGLEKGQGYWIYSPEGQQIELKLNQDE